MHRNAGRRPATFAAVHLEQSAIAHDMTNTRLRARIPIVLSLKRASTLACACIGDQRNGEVRPVVARIQDSKPEENCNYCLMGHTFDYHKNRRTKQRPRQSDRNILPHAPLDPLSRLPVSPVKATRHLRMTKTVQGGNGTG